MWTSLADRKLLQVQPSSQTQLLAVRGDRRDPLDNFRKYRGGYDVTNKHYWAVCPLTLSEILPLSSRRYSDIRQHWTNNLFVNPNWMFAITWCRCLVGLDARILSCIFCQPCICASIVQFSKIRNYSRPPLMWFPVAVSSVHWNLRLRYRCCMASARSAHHSGRLLQTLLLPSSQGSGATITCILLDPSHFGVSPIPLRHRCYYHDVRPQQPITRSRLQSAGQYSCFRKRCDEHCSQCVQHIVERGHHCQQVQHWGAEQ